MPCRISYKKRCVIVSRNSVFHVLLVLFSFAANAQNQSSDNRDSLRLHYEIAAKPYLYNGYEYIRFDRHVYGGLDPYYLGRAYSTGDLWYEGRHFHDVEMMYDLVNDWIVTPNHFSARSIGEVCLLPERIDSFTLNQHFFIHIFDSTQVHAGFYARLYNGRSTTLYGRYTKLFEKGKIMPQNEVWDVITPHTPYYLVIGGVFHPVNSRVELAKLLHLKKRDVKRYIRKQDLDFKHEKEAALVGVVSHFDPQ